MTHSRTLFYFLLFHILIFLRQISSQHIQIYCVPFFKLLSLLGNTTLTEPSNHRPDQDIGITKLHYLKLLLAAALREAQMYMENLTYVP